MHELSLVTNLIDLLVEQAAEHGFQRVMAVGLEVGDLSCVEPEALRFCFEAVRDGTLAAGAELRIRRVPGRARCTACGEEFEIDAYGLPCPACGGFRLEVLAGLDLRLRDLEVE